MSVLAVVGFFVILAGGAVVFPRVEDWFARGCAPRASTSGARGFRPVAPRSDVMVAARCLARPRAMDTGSGTTREGRPVVRAVSFADDPGAAARYFSEGRGPHPRHRAPFRWGEDEAHDLAREDADIDDRYEEDE